MATFGWVILYIAWFLGRFLLKAFMTMTIWNWFAPPLLNFPGISMAGALGLVTIVACFTPFEPNWEKLRESWDHQVELWRPMKASLAKAACLLAFGWIIRQFI